MFNEELLSQLHAVVTPARTCLVLLSPTATFDQTATAGALHAILQNLGKEVLLATPDIQKVSRHLPHLPDFPELKTDLGHENLQVSFDYSPTAVDNVSYHIDEVSQKFCLVIKPQPGHAPLGATNVEFTYTGGSAEVIFLVGVHDLEALDYLYHEYEDTFRQATLVTLHTFEPQLSAIKINSTGWSCLGEALTQLAVQMDWTIPASAATYLLQTIEEATDSFRSLATTAETFTRVARLLQLGGRRLRRSVVTPAMTGATPTAARTLQPNLPSSASNASSSAAQSFAAALSGAKSGVMVDDSAVPLVEIPPTNGVGKKSSPKSKNKDKNKDTSKNAGGDGYAPSYYR